MDQPAHYYDAHCHLHFSELGEVDLSAYFLKVKQAVVNGTSPADWHLVSELHKNFPAQVIPSFGVHPWEVNDLKTGWEEELSHYLQLHPTAGVGEVGLDKWIRGYELEKQEAVFRAQVERAIKEERPLSIHCLKAWGKMREVLTSYHGLRFLLHAYNGPLEDLLTYVEMGAYFSLSPSYFSERKAETLKKFQALPLDRLLIETDAPSMLGPPSTWSPLQSSFSRTQQHPDNIRPTYERAAELLQMECGALSSQIEQNFQRLFNQ